MTLYIKVFIKMSPRIWKPIDITTIRGNNIGKHRANHTINKDNEISVLFFKFISNQFYPTQRLRSFVML